MKKNIRFLTHYMFQIYIFVYCCKLSQLMNSLQGGDRITLVSCSALLRQKANERKERNGLATQVKGSEEVTGQLISNLTLCYISIKKKNPNQKPPCSNVIMQMYVWQQHPGFISPWKSKCKTSHSRGALYLCKVQQ